MTAGLLVPLNVFEVVLLLCVVAALSFALRRQSRQLNALLDLVEVLELEARDSRREAA